MSKAQAIVDRLQLVKPVGDGKWMACCPSHDDKSPSMRITELNDGRVLIHCFAGCTPLDMMAAIGLNISDLFPDDHSQHFRPIGPRRLKTPSEDEFLIEICKSARAQGRRLTTEEKRAEREAFLRIRGVK